MYNKGQIEAHYNQDLKLGQCRDYKRKLLDLREKTLTKGEGWALGGNNIIKVVYLRNIPVCSIIASTPGLNYHGTLSGVCIHMPFVKCGRLHFCQNTYVRGHYTYTNIENSTNKEGCSGGFGSRLTGGNILVTASRLN